MIFGKALTASVLNQVVSSGTSFVYGLYLVRVLTQVEFGLYGIGLAACLLFAGFGNALFLTQMVVHIPEKQVDDRSFYAAHILVLVGLFCLVTLIIIVAISEVGIFFGWISIPMSKLLFGIAVAAAANLLKNYFVQLAYSMKNENKALAINLVHAFTLITLILLQYGDYSIKDAATAFLVIAAANFMASLFGPLILHLPIKRISLTRLKSDLIEVSVGGKWALGGVTVTWLQSQVYIYVTTILIGPIGVAMANAARMLISPFMFLVPAFSQLLLPRLAELRSTNEMRMHRIGQFYTLILLGLGIIYILVLWLGTAYIIPLFLGSKYSVDEILPLVVVWGCVLLFQLARNGASIIMQAMKEFRNLTIVNTVTAIITLAISASLIVPMGVLGAILGVSIGEALLAILLWYQVRYR